LTDDPKVFGDGVVTITMGLRGTRIYVGTHMLKYVAHMRIQANGETGVNNLELVFPSSHDPQLAADIEINRRLAQSIPWIKVLSHLPG
jgi:hypothetical protein